MAPATPLLPAGPFAISPALATRVPVAGSRPDTAAAWPALAPPFRRAFVASPALVWDSPPKDDICRIDARACSTKPQWSST